MTKGISAIRNRNIKRNSQSLTNSEALEHGNESEKSYGRGIHICVSCVAEDFTLTV